MSKICQNEKVHTDTNYEICGKTAKFIVKCDYLWGGKSMYTCESCTHSLRQKVNLEEMRCGRDLFFSAIFVENEDDEELDAPKCSLGGECESCQ